MHLQSTFSTDALCGTASKLRANLARSVFDGMLERDLLGLLLSSRHFKVFLSKQCFDASARELELAQEIAEDEQEVAAFHQYMLAMFSGIYIEECKHADHEALMADLDAKCADLMISPDDTDSPNSNSVELAWRYRRFCSGHDTVTP